MSNLSLGAQPPLEFIPPDLNLLLLKGCQIFLPLWLQTQTNLREISAANLETLITFYQKSQEKKVRLLLAFRHPSINDPYCMAYLLWKLVPKKAQELGIKLPAPIHAHFMYDRGIPLWAGERVGWLYSKLGGTPIQRGKADLIGLRSARRLLLEGDYPLAAAPEGATNGHNELVSAIEPGISQLAFWGVDDVRKAKQQQEVIILPIGIQYFYMTPVWQEIEQILTNLENDSGLEPTPNSSREEKVLYERLFRLGERLLSLMEDFYRDFYYTHSISPLELGLADRLADEANLKMWHMRIVESFVSVTGYYVKEKPTVERFAETILLLWDLVTRIKGGNPFFRPQIGQQKAIITIGKPISVSERYGDYKSDRRSAVAQLTQDLQTSLESLIIHQ